MESKPTNVEELFEKLKEYADTRLELFKLKSVNKISGFTSSVLTMIVLVLVLSVVLFCITIGLALVIGDWTGKAYYGFFIVAGIYFIIGLVLYSKRDKLIKTPVSNKLIKELFD
ncbi:MAG: phage holin family protein [Ginsengibacter sp.]